VLCFISADLLMVCAYKISYSTRACLWCHIVHVCQYHAADHSMEHLMSAAGYDSQPYRTDDIYMMKSMCLIIYIPCMLQSGMITITDTNNIAIHVYTIDAMHCRLFL